MVVQASVFAAVAAGAVLPVGPFIQVALRRRFADQSGACDSGLEAPAPVSRSRVSTAAFRTGWILPAKRIEGDLSRLRFAVPRVKRRGRARSHCGIRLVDPSFAGPSGDG